MMGIVICDCEGFVLWYTTEQGIPVCRCGHTPEEHIDSTGPCVGEVIRVRWSAPRTA